MKRIGLTAAILAAFCLHDRASADGTLTAFAAGDPRVTSEHAIDMHLPSRGGGLSPAIASNGTMFLTAWQSGLDSSFYNIRVARMLADGRVLDPGGAPITVDSQAQKPGVGSDGKNFFVAWRVGQLRQLLGGALISPDGKILARATFTSPSVSGSSDRPPAIAFNGSSYLLVWQAQRVYAAVVSPVDLSVLRGPIAVSADAGVGSDPAVVWNGQQFAVAWSRSDGAYISRLNASGDVIDAVPVHFAGNLPADSYSVGLAWSGDQYLLAWHSSAVRLDASLAPLSPGILTLNGYGPSVAWNGTNFLVATPGAGRVQVSVVTEDGSLKTGVGATTSTTIRQDSAKIAAAGSTTALTYNSGSMGDIFGRVLTNFSPDGTPNESSPALVLSSSGFDHAPGLAGLENSDLLVWSGMMAARVDFSGTPLFPFAYTLYNSSTAANPSVVSVDRGAMAVWSENRVATAGAYFNSSGSSSPRTTGPLLNPSLAGALSQYLLAAENTGSGHSVVAERVSEFGSFIDANPITIYSAPDGNTGAQPGSMPEPPDSLAPQRSGYLPSVASDSQNYLVVWNSPAQSASPEPGASPSAIYASRVSGYGQLLDAAPIQVTSGSDHAWAPAAAWTARAYLVAWLQKSDSASPDAEILAAPVFPDGQVGPVKVIASGPRRRTSVALTPYGSGFLAVWREVNEDEVGTSDIVCAALNPDGTPARDGTFTIASGRICTDPVITVDNAGPIIANEVAQPNGPQIVLNRIQVERTPRASLDYTTRGDWTTRYSDGGFWIAGDAKQLPPTVEVTVENASSWVWDDHTTAPSALQRASSAARIAACWFSPGSFDVHIRFADSAEHQVAFYVLDWDTSDRAELVQVFDNATGELLRSQYLSEFHDGEYWIFNLKGDVRVRFTAAAGLNAVLSGIFFPGLNAPAGQVATPVIQPNGGTFNSTVNVTLSSGTPGADIFYTRDGSTPGTNSTRYLGTIVLSETTTLKVIAVKSGLNDSARASAIFTKVANDTNAPIRLVAHDTSTEGNWSGKYGSDGYIIFGDSQKLPPYAQVSLANGVSSWIWNDSTSDPAALQRASNPAQRIAACVYSPDTVEISISQPLGETHRIAVYCLDWDTTERSESITVLQNDNSWFFETISGFHQGEYLVWEVNGPITLSLRRMAGNNAVISGIFFDPVGQNTAFAAPPQITPGGGTFSDPVQVSLTSATEGASIYYTLDGTTPSTASTRYSAPFTISSSATVTARAFANGINPSTVATANFTIQSASSSATASFVGFDSSTQGTWRGTYGISGYMIARDGASTPADTTITLSGQSDHIWAYAVTDPAALQMAGTESRIASCWYSASSFDMSVSLPETGTHKVSLYFLDWDRAGRSEKIEVIDDATGAVLGTENAGSFAEGVWACWTVRGKVKFRITPVTGPNAVISGIFVE